MHLRVLQLVRNAAKVHIRVTELRNARRVVRVLITKLKATALVQTAKPVIIAPAVPTRPLAAKVRHQVPPRPLLLPPAQLARPVHTIRARLIPPVLIAAPVITAPAVPTELLARPVPLQVPPRLLLLPPVRLALPVNIHQQPLKALARLVQPVITTSVRATRVVQTAVPVITAPAVLTEPLAARVRHLTLQTLQRRAIVRLVRPVHTPQRQVKAHARLAAPVIGARAVQTEQLALPVHIQQRQTLLPLQPARTALTANGQARAEAQLAAITAKPVMLARTETRRNARPVIGRQQVQVLVRTAPKVNGAVQAEQRNVQITAKPVISARAV